MIKTFKYRLKDRRAAKKLSAHAYGVNQVWNWCVAQHEDSVNRYRLGAPKRRWLSAFSLGGECSGVGKALGILQDTVDVVCHQFVRARDQHKFVRFRSSFGTNRALGWVPFKARTPQIDGNSITYRGNTFRFFGSRRRPLPEHTRDGAFVEDALGRWWVCLNVEIEDGHRPASGEVGIDLGLKDFAVTSDGLTFQSPKSYRDMEAKLAAAQRAGNKRRAKALHVRAANIRRDFHHKLSRQLANDYAFIAVGNVSSSKLAKTRMAKSVLDAGWSAFRTMLAYKAAQFVEVDEKFTTQACSCCGAIPDSSPKGIGALEIRSWACSVCGEAHSRDVNAARNILRIGRSVAPLVEGSRGVQS